MVRQLRGGQQNNGLILANGGVLSYQHAICISKNPRRDGSQYPDSSVLKSQIDMPIPPIDLEAEGKAEIEARSKLITTSRLNGFHPAFPPLKRELHARATEFLQNYDPDLSDSQRTVREAIAKICSNFPEEYWARKDETHQFPTELHSALASQGWLGICLPQRYGGSELGISEAAIMMQTISESGAGMTGASSIHMNIFGLEPVEKFGTDEQKEKWLTPLIDGRERACFGVTEPNTGLDTLKLQSTARRDGDRYVLSGQKIWISTAQKAEKILILVRTTPLDRVQKRSQGLSLFYTDLHVPQVEITEIPKMGRAAVDTNTLFFDDWPVPVTDRVGEENEGFKMILHGMNAERILIGAEALGLGFAALRRAALYAGRERYSDVRLARIKESNTH
ncbi:hypothetical protein N7532_000807 [Penicillium argentinense]|uniref:Acyl-CoA dehydrogenase n=1 Tax=Penicillium argentinense TaxID=1131581 RepID=A0A9W9G7E9_9EURO|nr:uncharacterized protein N7532_000807 [Penicillium argentinense]KAJ5112762.1 hypothetical protein N7532_000807 [Penicillium argentinense]